VGKGTKSWFLSWTTEIIINCYGAASTAQLIPLNFLSIAKGYVEDCIKNLTDLLQTAATKLSHPKDTCYTVYHFLTDFLMSQYFVTDGFTPLAFESDLDYSTWMDMTLIGA
jgi:hypothetical protein